MYTRAVVYIRCLDCKPSEARLVISKRLFFPPRNLCARLSSEDKALVSLVCIFLSLSFFLSRDLHLISNFLWNFYFEPGIFKEKRQFMFEARSITYNRVTSRRYVIISIIYRGISLYLFTLLIIPVTLSTDIIQ